MLETQNSFVIKISKIISNFFNPLTSFFLFYLYFSLKNFTREEAISNFLPIFFIILLPISLWIFWNVKKGNYTNMDVSNRNQRKSLYFFIAAAILVYLIYEYFVNNHLNHLDFIMLFISILLILMQISNYYIKSSMHTAFNVFVSALFFVENITLGIVWILLSIVVGITRIILKRHTPKEVLMGFSIATFVSLMYIYVMIQNN